MAGVRLGVVTALANERACITDFMDEVLRYLEVGDRWYCVLDKVSTDGTREIVEERSKTDARVVYVWAPQNRCLADAFFAGYNAAFESGCDWILEIDAGFSYPPSKIPEFLAAMEAGYDYVASSRFMPGGAHRSPWTRRAFSFGGTLLARNLLGSRMTDMTGGFECFSKTAMEFVLKRGVRSRANTFHVEIKQMMHQFKWKEIPIVYLNDHYGIGRSAIREGLRVIIQMAFKAHSTDRPVDANRNSIRSTKKGQD